MASTNWLAQSTDALPSSHPRQHLADIPLVQEAHERIAGSVLLPLVFGRLGDLLRDLLAVEPGDHGERHVRAGRDTRGSRERPILYPARLLDPLHGRALRSREIEELLVRSRSASVE